MAVDQITLSKHLKFYVAIMALLALLIYQYSAFQSEKQRYSDLTDEYEVYKIGAESRFNELSEEYDALSGDYSILETSSQTLQSEVDSIIEKINTYELDLAESMDWFKENSNFNGLEDAVNIERFLDRRCMMADKSKCTIKTGCFYLTNSEYLDLEFLYDVETSGEIEKLQTLEAFVENKGGDCEDYSLFYKAEINHALEMCNEAGSQKIYLESWGPADYGRYILDFKERWYLVNPAKAIYLEEDYIYPNIICGNIFDLNSQTVSGHCTIAFTKNKIILKEDLLNELDGAPIVEPQNGRYMGLINDESSGIYLLSATDSKEDFDSYIYEVITDQDLFLFSEAYNDWLSYSSFSEEFKEKKAELLKMK